KVIRTKGIEHFFSTLFKQLLSDVRMLEYEKLKPYKSYKKQKEDRKEMLTLIKAAKSLFKESSYKPPVKNDNKPTNKPEEPYQDHTSKDKISKKKKPVAVPSFSNEETQNNNTKTHVGCRKREIVCHILMFIFSIYYIFRLGAGFGKPSNLRLIACFMMFLVYFLFLM
ncbi:hypothetical protein CDIK_2663, partial [Cucumispora dikerogammari]